ncbi:hypothetical protein AGMMS49992_23780 [Clostridia bacterium]|nr:hypothetical protein AGMMS49992_23780 [Clostridia bacterium]
MIKRITAIITLLVLLMSAAAVADNAKVWVTATGKKYHAVVTCGNINPKTAKQVTLELVKAKGIKPCAKCVQN